MGKNTAVLIILIGILMISCDNNFKKNIEISDFSQNEKFEISFKLPEGKYVDRIKIDVIGQLDDTVKLGKYYLVPAIIDTTFSHEWYSSDYTLYFNPMSASGGRLSIDLEFIVL